MDLKQVKTDPKTEIEGVWIDLDEKSKIRVARLGNDNYTKLLTKRLKPYRQSFRAGTLDNAILKNIMSDVIAETVLLDWKNLEENGKVIKYSTEEARRLLREYPDFREIVTSCAEDQQLYRVVDLEDTAKN